MERGTSYMLLVRAFAVFMIVGIIGAVVLFPLLPYLFSRIFGTDWSEAGHFGQLLIPMVVTSLAVSPISQTPLVYEKQEWDMYWQLCFMLGAVVTITIGGLLDSTLTALLSYSIFSALMYLVDFGISVRIAGGQLTRLPYYMTRMWSRSQT